MYVFILLNYNYVFFKSLYFTIFIQQLHAHTEMMSKHKANRKVN